MYAFSHSQSSLSNYCVYNKPVRLVSVPKPTPKLSLKQKNPTTPMDWNWLFFVLFFFLLSLITDMSLWGLLLWGSSIISALELTTIVLFSNPNNGEPNVDLHSSNNADTNDAYESHRLREESNIICSTPYVSAPSSLGRGCPAVGYFSSAPTSPMHYVLSTAPRSDSFLSTESSSFEFEFSSGFLLNGSVGNRSMSSLDELFLNGQIRPMSPLRATQFQCQEHEENEASHHHHRILELEDSENKEVETLLIETTPSGSASSSRSSSSGRTLKKWILFKDLLYRSKTEGIDNKKKFWSSITFICSSSSRDEKEKNRKETQKIDLRKTSERRQKA
ncbi:uncharacterized protein LOC114322049 [Camellia sinensis]|uniref:uncharacterized protein LOC114322049 n=1 Tax=Camellia sinensis TaxID=4442 RepID=UPI0010357EBB|nr:uncharacterized protein LOC114322049 [Camellia sinensis]